MTATTSTQGISSPPAFVARIADYAGDGPAYLRLDADGAMAWVAAQSDATPFPSMREATRHATRLPARLRAFGLPLRN